MRSLTLFQLSVCWLCSCGIGSNIRSLFSGRCIHRIVKVYKLLAKCGISNQLLLYTAVEKQAYDVVKFLLQEASANVNGEYPPGSRMTPILYALDPSGIFGYIHAGQYKRRNLTYSKEDFMRVCIEEMSSEHDPHAELFEILVATGSNLNVRDPDGNCPVHRLGICKYESSKHVDTKILKIMLSCKHFDINARGKKYISKTLHTFANNQLTSFFTMSIFDIHFRPSNPQIFLKVPSECI